MLTKHLGACSAPLSLLIAGHVVLTIFTVLTALMIGSIGFHQDAKFMSKFVFWHGVAVLFTCVLAAAGCVMALSLYFAQLSLLGEQLWPVRVRKTAGRGLEWEMGSESTVTPAVGAMP